MPFHSAVRRVVVLSLLATAALPGAAAAEFPYAYDGTEPNDMTGKLDWMYSATPEEGNLAAADPRELGGVRGAWLADEEVPEDAVAWGTTTGRPDVTIAVLDSGIEWDNRGAMVDLRRKTRLTRAELPQPLHDRTTALEPGVDCTTYRDADDANRDGVFDVLDFACDSRVERDPAERAADGDPRGVGPADLLDPQDVLIAFTDGDDDDGNGYADDIVGWDFLDDDNDPYDDVGYGHGTGEALDSVAEADNGGNAVGTCPNCMAIHMRVGDSFIADVNRFAAATLYASDNDVEVVQEALGTLNQSTLARESVEYAHRHGVTIIASAADEAAEHHNWPSSYPHVILVNSVRQYIAGLTGMPTQGSYLQFNGCTNFSSKITVAIPSVSCSSDATGRAAGMAGLVHSAAFDARDAGDLDEHETCRRTDGRACVITPDEVRQLMAAGRVGDAGQADDIDFAAGDGASEGSCATRLTTCTDPNSNAPYDRTPPFASPTVGLTQRYPTRDGHDQFFGYGRVNMDRAVDRLRPGDGAVLLPPGVSITGPEWFARIDPERPAQDVRGVVDARGATFTCRVEVAPGAQPNNATTAGGGDFAPVTAPGPCDGTTTHDGRIDGLLGTVDLAALRERFPVGRDFHGREPGELPQQPAATHGRPNTLPHAFTVRVVATVAGQGTRPSLTGEDRRQLFLHRDQDLLDGFPRSIGGDGASSPLLVDLDGDNRNELVIAGSDGVVHAYRRDGSELPGWPVRGDLATLHRGARAFTSGEVSGDARGAILASVAAADLDRDGAPEVVAADLEGKVYAFGADGSRRWAREANPDFSGRPLQPFEDVRRGSRHRTQHGFLASPVLADLDRDGSLEVIAAGMDRHVYAWRADGAAVPGFPLVVVDRSKVASIDPQTHRVNFDEAAAGPPLQQGPIVDTPAVGDVTGDGVPEIVVGTNEEYRVNTGNEGRYNSSTFNAATVEALATVGGIPVPDELGGDNPTDLGLASANSRIYALRADGATSDADGTLPGWPAKVGVLQAQILPVVGEGITGAPAIGPATCPLGGDGGGQEVLTIPAAGPGYLFTASGVSCYGRDPQGRDVTLDTEPPPSATDPDRPVIPAFGHPAFGRLGEGVSLLAPATGLRRAIDVAVPEYQGGQDVLAAWVPASGEMRPGFPAQVNDLQFLTGPSVADIGGPPGEEVLAGTASLDLHAFTAAGTEASGKWPKLTGDWLVANPLVGSFGELETAGDARKVVAVVTRDGTLQAYATDGGACAPASWPRFHHDNASSGDFARDAVSPGRPADARAEGDRLTFTAPGDDLLCGTVAGYETRANGEAAWRDARVEDPAEPGERQALPLPGGTTVQVRAFDEQGNVGRPVEATVRGPQTTPGGGAPGGGTTTGSGSTCRDATAPRARLSGLRRVKGRRVLRGRVRDRACAVRRIRVRTVVARRAGKRCRFARGGRLHRRRSCARPPYGKVRRTRGAFRVRVARRLRPGRYIAFVQARDAAGNVQRIRRPFRIR